MEFIELKSVELKNKENYMFLEKKSGKCEAHVGMKNLHNQLEKNNTFQSIYHIRKEQ